MIFTWKTNNLWAFREKLESETKALMEANLQLEEKQHRVQRLEAAQRLAQKTSSDEVRRCNTFVKKLRTISKA